MYLSVFFVLLLLPFSLPSPRPVEPPSVVEPVHELVPHEGADVTKVDGHGLAGGEERGLQNAGGEQHLKSWKTIITFQFPPKNWFLKTSCSYSKCHT